MGTKKTNHKAAYKKAKSSTAASNKKAVDKHGSAAKKAGYGGGITGVDKYLFDKNSPKRKAAFAKSMKSRSK